LARWNSSKARAQAYREQFLAIGDLYVPSWEESELIELRELSELEVYDLPKTFEVVDIDLLGWKIEKNDSEDTEVG
jgi:hypothetical protein